MNQVAIDRGENDVLLIRLAGQWELRHGLASTGAVESELQREPRPSRITFDTRQLGRWDTSILAFLVRVSDACRDRGVALDSAALPAGLRNLLGLAEAVREPVGARKELRAPGFLERIGEPTLGVIVAAGETLSFIGNVTVASARLVRMKARYRASDLSLLIQQCGVEALPIVTLISFLVGVILAFISAVQLRQFGAQLYVADLVGVAMTREMGALMSAILMAGRTGAAFAAELGTMKVTQELDAFTTAGFSVVEYLVLPRVLALVLMMPLLCLYADFVGVLGGAVIGVGMLDLSWTTYVQETTRAVRLGDTAGGLFKSAVYGGLIATAGCWRGLQSGSSASDVGRAATSAVVTSMIVVVAACGVFAFLFYVLGTLMTPETATADGATPCISVRDLTMAYGSRVLMRDMTFSVNQGDVFVIMGASGSGKSTLLRHLIGLNQPAHGSIYYRAENFTLADSSQRERILRNVGILFQGGALWSAMTLSENVGLLLEEYTDLTPAQIRQVASLKLALVGLRGFEDYYPSEISGGMQKRAGLARAMALDPDILFFDEPSAGLDPISARRLDELILQLRDSLGITAVVVSHDLASIFAIGTNSIYLDVSSQAITASGPPAELLARTEDSTLRSFLTRGGNP